VGSLLRLNSTCNSRGSEIISHFRPVAVRCGSGVAQCSPVRSGAVNSHTGTPVGCVTWQHACHCCTVQTYKDAEPESSVFYSLRSWVVSKKVRVIVS